MLLTKGRREASLITPHPAPLWKEDGSSGKWGGPGGHQDHKTPIMRFGRIMVPIKVPSV
jgi:hypothetical protein